MSQEIDFFKERFLKELGIDFSTDPPKLAKFSNEDAYKCSQPLLYFNPKKHSEEKAAEIARKSEGYCEAFYYDKGGSELIQQYISELVDIKHPSYTLVKKKIQQCGQDIRFVQAPTEELQLIAIQQDEDNFGFIANPTSKVILEVLKKNYRWIKRVPNPTTEMLEIAKDTEYNISYLDYPPEWLQLEVVEKWCNAIRFIEAPSLEVQKRAIVASGYNLNTIALCPDWEDLAEDIYNFVIAKMIIS